MLKNFKFRDPQTLVRTVLGVLLAANLIAAGLVLFPPGGSAEDLEQQRISLQSQLKARQATLERTRQHATAVEKGRSEGDQFLSGYFLSSRTAFSSVLSQLEAAASQSKIKQRERGFSTEPIEGSDSLSMMSITAAYEGTYGDLMHFVHELDRSPNLLVVESLTAAPLANSPTLTVSMKFDTFVRDEGPPAP
ncbi:MAG TPA: hypothetical protein VKR43_00635 [Bryobacteraceae bacterium]|nr:hypothetical protein [Bryobacteraceae bacterium]